MARKVLIVEDESNIAELINLYLKKEGYETMIAEDGGAFTAHTTNPVPLVLVDASGSDLALSGAEGCLADIARTLLAMIGLPHPPEMTGESLLA